MNLKPRNFLPAWEYGSHGHAGAIIAGSGGTVAGKLKSLEESGARVGNTIAGVIDMIKKEMGN